MIRCIVFGDEFPLPCTGPRTKDFENDVGLGYPSVARVKIHLSIHVELVNMQQHSRSIIASSIQNQYIIAEYAHVTLYLDFLPPFYIVKCD